MITNLVNTSLCNPNLSATTKDELFDELASALLADGRITDKDAFLADVRKREEDSITCLEGIAYPHAKSEHVKVPAISVGVKNASIEYGDEDGNEPTVFFMIASPVDGDHHITVLQELFSKFCPEFVEAMNAASTPEEMMAVLTSPDFE